MCVHRHYARLCHAASVCVQNTICVVQCKLHPLTIAICVWLPVPELLSVCVCVCVVVQGLNSKLLCNEVKVSGCWLLSRCLAS